MFTFLLKGFSVLVTAFVVWALTTLFVPDITFFMAKVAAAIGGICGYILMNRATRDVTPEFFDSYLQVR